MMSKIMVPLIVLSNIIFTTVILVMFWYRGQEPMALIGAWFAFTTGELWAMAIISKEKVKREEVKHYENHYREPQFYKTTDETKSHH